MMRLCVGLVLAWLVAGVHLVRADAQAPEQSAPAPKSDPAFAGTIKDANAHGSGGHAAEKPPGILDVVLDLTVWTIVVFLVLLFLLSKYAWKPMLDGLQKREQNIRAAMEEAQRAQDEAQRIQAQFQQQMHDAAERVRDMMDAARKDAQRVNEEMIAKAKSEIQAERDRLRREIESARDQAVQELWKQTAQLATQISAKAIRRRLNEDDHRRLVDEALVEMGQTAGKRGNGR